MLLLNELDARGGTRYVDFNTSYVVIKQSIYFLCYLCYNNFNTSYVVIKP